MVDKVKWITYKTGEEDLPTASEDQRGQTRVKPHSISEQGDRLMFCRLNPDGTTYEYLSLLGMTIQEDNVTVYYGMTVLDFRSPLVVTTPVNENEAVVEIDQALSRQNQFLIETHSASGSFTTSTASTVVWSHSIEDMTLQLPEEGTWQVHAIGSCLITHSAGTQGQIRILIDGNGGNPATLNLGTAEPRMSCEHVVSGLTYDGVSGQDGVVHCHLEFKSVDAGTTSTRNPTMQLIAIRTA